MLSRPISPDTSLCPEFPQGICYLPVGMETTSTQLLLWDTATNCSILLVTFANVAVPTLGITLHILYIWEKSIYYAVLV